MKQLNNFNKLIIKAKKLRKMKVLQILENVNVKNKRVVDVLTAMNFIAIFAQISIMNNL